MTRRATVMHGASAANGDRWGVALLEQQGLLFPEFLGQIVAKKVPQNGGAKFRRVGMPGAMPDLLRRPGECLGFQRGPDCWSKPGEIGVGGPAFLLGAALLVALDPAVLGLAAMPLLAQAFALLPGGGGLVPFGRRVVVL